MTTRVAAAAAAVDSTDEIENATAARINSKNPAQGIKLRPFTA
jgi:hypothetical protein